MYVYSWDWILINQNRRNALFKAVYGERIVCFKAYVFESQEKLLPKDTAVALQIVHVEMEVA